MRLRFSPDSGRQTAPARQGYLRDGKAYRLERAED